MSTTETGQLVPSDNPGSKPVGTALQDFRSSMMSMPKEDMQAALAEYTERRLTLRDWLRSNLIEGVHYGWPMGKPKITTRGGVEGAVTSKKKKGRNGEADKWEEVFTPLTQWTQKPSLYAAGADFICDLMWLRDEYKADMQTWEQMGKKPGIIVQQCTLFSKSNGETISEGRGAWVVGNNAMYENSGIKMAKKSAKIDAVLSAYGLRDLFTQDLEHGKGPLPEENPEPKADAPKAAPRAERVTKEQVAALSREWTASKFSEGVDLSDRQAAAEHYKKWARVALKMPADWNPLVLSEWDFDLYQRCATLLGIPE